MLHSGETAAQRRLVDDRAVDLDSLVKPMKDRSDHNCLKNYTRLWVFSWICLELMAQTNQIGTGTRVRKNDDVPENSNDSQ